MMIERLLEYLAPGATEPSTVRVTISAPVQTPNGSYQSTLSIEGLNAPYAAPFEQVDPLGAVLAAASIAPTVLYARVPKGGRLTWLEGEDLGFPLLTPPKHHWIFRPATGGKPREIALTIGPPKEIEGEWACLVTLTTRGGDEERWVKGETWAHALERAAASVPIMLQEFIETAGGGQLEDYPPP